MGVYKVLTINPGSTSTKIAVYKGEENGDENKVTIYSIDLN